MVDLTQTQVAENGFEIENGPIFTGGSTSPLGNAAPIGSVYNQTDGYSWLKVGSGANDWFRFPFNLSESSQAIAYLGNGEVDTVTFYKSASQVVANRLALVQMAYDLALNPTSETWTIYNEVNGTTVLKTVTFTYTFSGDNLTSAGVAVT